MFYGEFDLVFAYYNVVGFLLASFYNVKYRLRFGFRLKRGLKENIFLAHVPKCAGTSICAALNIVDPGHFNLSNSNFYGKQIIFVWRDPIDRLGSVYRYANKPLNSKINSPLWMINKFDSFDSFIASPWFKTYFLRLYFFMPARAYLPANYADSKVKLIAINFEDVADGIYNSFGVEIQKRNSTVKSEEYEPESFSIKIIKEAFWDDYKLYSELFEITK